MKIKKVVTILLIAFNLASCAPAATSVPTEVVIPSSTFTPIPPAPTITPTPAPENIADAKDLSIWVDEYVHAYGDKVIVNGVEMEASQLTDKIRQNGDKFTQTKNINGTSYLFVVVNNTPIAMQENSGKWKKATFAKIASKLGLTVTVRLNLHSDEVVPQIATTLQMEYGDTYELYNDNFDWSKITSNWDDIQSKLLQDTIPYQNEIFNENGFGYGQITEQVQYAQKHNLEYKGDCLFAPLHFYRHETYNKLSPDEQKKILFFMAAAKLIKFPEIKTIALECELIAWELWGDNPAENQKRFQNLGGADFLVEFANFVKQVKPDVKLIIIEDLIYYNCPCYKNLYDGIYQQQDKMFFELLAELKEKNAPIDEAMTENNMWIFAPPDREFIANTLQKIKDSGYDIAASETIVGVENYPPYSEGYIPPITMTPVDYPYQKQAEIYAMLLDVTLSQGAKNFGFGSASDGTGDIFDENQKPKIAYYETLRVLYGHVP